MEITDKRINQLIEQFYTSLSNNGIDSTLEYLSWPGGIVWITEKQYQADKGYDEGTVAYIRKMVEHGNTPGAVNIPLFKIVLIKERALKLSDEEFLHLLAHECSHIFFGVKKHPDEELACDVLAEHFFGFSKPKGSTIGYLYDDEAFREIYGDDMADKFLKED